MHIAVDSTMTVKEAYQLAEQIEFDTKKEFDTILEMNVIVEPAQPADNAKK
jgi:divalent metal cation (Fe/Co/Zn/Cd) transporter